MDREYIRIYNSLIATGEDTIEKVAELRTKACAVMELPEGMKDYILKTIHSENQLNSAPEWITNNFTDFNNLKQSL